MRVNAVGVELRVRTSNSVVHHAYSMPCSNALWHIDGLHCLIYNGGLLPMVALMDTQGTSVHLTIIKVLFLEATRAYGWPSHVRSDCGGENIEVAGCMTSTRGHGRRSHLASSSVHNQMVERLWRDTFRCVFHLYFSVL